MSGATYAGYFKAAGWEWVVLTGIFSILIVTARVGVDVWIASWVTNEHAGSRTWMPGGEHLLLSTGDGTRGHIESSGAHSVQSTHYLAGLLVICSVGTLVAACRIWSFRTLGMHAARNMYKVRLPLHGHFFRLVHTVSLPRLSWHSSTAHGCRDCPCRCWATLGAISDIPSLVFAVHFLGGSALAVDAGDCSRHAAVLLHICALKTDPQPVFH